MKAYQWQPIETAPKDMTPVDIWSAEYGRLAGYMLDGLFSGDPYYRPVISEGPGVVTDATHWMTIPSDPNEEATND